MGICKIIGSCLKRIRNIKLKRFVPVAQKAGEYFGNAAGFAGIAMSVVAVFVTTPTMCPFLTIAILGLLWAIVGWKKGLVERHEEEDQQEKTNHAFENIAEMKEDLQDLKEEVKEDFQELKQGMALARRHSEPCRKSTPKASPASSYSSHYRRFNNLGFMRAGSNTTPKSNSPTPAHSEKKAEAERTPTPPGVLFRLTVFNKPKKPVKKPILKKAVNSSVMYEKHDSNDSVVRIHR